MCNPSYEHEMNFSKINEIKDTVFHIYQYFINRNNVNILLCKIPYII